VESGLNKTPRGIPMVLCVRSSVRDCVRVRLNTIESKMSATANVARENEEIIKLKLDLSNERERYMGLELNMLEIVREKNNEIQNLN
jgi:hypothetical protein